MIYVAGGLAAVWDGRPLARTDLAEAPAYVRWSWIPPLLAAAVGAVSAVMALVAEGTDGSGGTTLVVAASLGVILSWILLQVGFAQMYLVVDAATPGDGLRFPEGTTPSMLAYLYFAFTVGTSFATSDVEVVGIPLRRLVLVHGVVAFFYNALVVAIAFQLLQGAVT